MKKVINKLCGVLLLLTLTLGFTACSGERGSANGNTNQSALNQPNDTAATPEPTPQPTTDQSREHTLEELGATIVAAGEFWNDWWWRNGAFAWGHTDDSMSNFQPFNEDVAPAHHPLSRGFSIFLPSSGFTSLNDIGVFLSQFYTQSWVDRGQFAEPLVVGELMPGEETQFFGWTNAFEEYNGRLYIFTWNESQPRPEWRTATHTLIEQDGSHAIVETVVSTYFHGFEGGGLTPTITYRFTLIDGRIDNAYGYRQEIDSLHTSHVQQGFYTAFRDAMLFAYRTEDVVLASFDAIHEIELPNFGDFAVRDGDVLIGATQTIYNISLVIFENVWDEAANQDAFTIADSFWITETLQPGEGIFISGYLSAGYLPWSGVTFTVAPGERYFFAINHDNSGTPYPFVLWDITGQIMAG